MATTANLRKKIVSMLFLEIILFFQYIIQPNFMKSIY